MDLNAYFTTRDTSRDQIDTMPIEIRGALRSDLPAYLAARGARVGAEIGVYEGAYSEELCRGIPHLQLFCVDHWVPFPVNGPDGKPRMICRRARQHYLAAQQRLAPYGCTFLRQFSLDAARTIEDRSLDFVYIDADHRAPAVIADIETWTPKVRKGGILAGHDYEPPNIYNDVAPAVEAWARDHHVIPWFVLGRRRVRRGELWERHRTWLWEVR